jgi:hypothetical protein
MESPDLFQFDPGGSVDIFVGNHVSFPTAASGRGLDVVRDSHGTHIMLSYSSGMIVAQRADQSRDKSGFGTT